MRKSTIRTNEPAMARRVERKERMNLIGNKNVIISSCFPFSILLLLLQRFI